MKYLLLVYSNPASWEHPTFLHHGDDLSTTERDRMTEEFTGLLKEIFESGELVGSEPLGAPASAMTVDARGGVPVTTDGPFAEAKEQLAGYFLVDTETEERAVAIASRIPETRYGAVVVHPVAQVSVWNPRDR